MHDNSHSVFIPPDNKDAKIWRFIDIQKFWSLLERNSLHFSKVTTFTDPYEGMLPEYNMKMGRTVYLEQKDKFQSEEQFEIFLQTRVSTMLSLYKQYRETTLVNCWHLNEIESASMWKLYASNDSGIAIQSTYSKFSECLKNNSSDTVWIGKVNYSDFKKEWMKEWNVYEAFVNKRKSFEAESELRAVTSLPDDNNRQKVLSDSDKERESRQPTKPRIIDPTELTENGKFVHVDLDSLIEKIYVAPLATIQFEKMVRSLTEKFKVNLVEKIEKSDLYTIR